MSLYWLPLVGLWTSRGLAFGPTPVLEGRKKPVVGLQRHPLIYPIFPCNLSPAGLALSSRRGTSTSSPSSGELKGSAAISPLFTCQVLPKIMAKSYRGFYVLSRGIREIPEFLRFLSVSKKGRHKKDTLAFFPGIKVNRMPEIYLFGREHVLQIEP